MKISYLLISVLAIPFFSFAEQESEVPFLSGEQGTKIQATWKDGREATAMMGTIAPIVLEVPLTIFENSCNEISISKCRFLAGLHYHRVHFLWTKHPEPQKIGKSVRTRIKNITQYDDFFPSRSILLPVNKITSPLAAQDVADDELVCDDYSFLPQNPFSGTHLQILKWESEAMFNNAELGITENRSIGGALNIELLPESGHRLKLKVNGGYTNLFSAPLAFGDVISLTLKNSDGSLCQIGIKPDTSAAAVKYLNYFNTPEETLQPYLAGFDDLSWKVMEALQFTFKHPETFEVEP